MFCELLTRISDAARVVVRRIREAIKPKSALGGVIGDLTRTREELESENAALRQPAVSMARLTTRRTPSQKKSPASPPAAARP